MDNFDFEEEVRELKVKNNDLVQKVQFWKMKAAQLEKDKVELMKENNDIRLKLSRMRSGGAAQARALDGALQTASEEALSHLVQASSAVTRTMELAKNYMKERQELEMVTPRWSSIGGTPVKERVHKVPPMMMGGRSIQPYVSLNRVPLNNSSSVASSRSPNQSVPERVLPLPMHMLQDVYITLQRIDASELRNNLVPDQDIDTDNGTEDLMEDNAENELNDSHISEEDEEELDMSRQLAVVHEDMEETTEEIGTPNENTTENPLEGPSWLLDEPRSSKVPSGSRSWVTLEADSTTEPDELRPASPPRAYTQVEGEPSVEAGAHCVFTPTVRRRRRASPPQPQPLDPPHSSKSQGRVLKVVVPKMSLETLDAGGDASPAKRSLRFDAPSPNGATDAALIVLEQLDQSESTSVAENSNVSDTSSRREGSLRDSESEGGRSRRARKQVVYKEKPLNRKLRR